MTSLRTRVLLAAAIFLTGVLAGGVIDRVIVGGPAWHELGVEAWVQYSRHADLGTGLVVYPMEGIGSAVLLLGTAVSNYFDGNAGRRAAFPIYLALTFSIIGLLLTVKAAPIMLALGRDTPRSSLQSSFDAFFLWGLNLRGLSDTIAFASAIWALSSLGKLVVPVANKQ